jgi:hypothetical protein
LTESPTRVGFLPDAVGGKTYAKVVFPTPLAKNPTCGISSHRVWRKIPRVGFLPTGRGEKTYAKVVFPRGVAENPTHGISSHRILQASAPEKIIIVSLPHFLLKKKNKYDNEKSF